MNAGDAQQIHPRETTAAPLTPKGYRKGGSISFTCRVITKGKENTYNRRST